MLVKIPTILDGMGRSNILPRQTLEHRLHLAETVSHEGSRNSWKFGGDALLTSIYDFFPHQQSGEYLFYPVKVNPFTFQPVQGGLELSPLRAYAHEIPHYYLQNFGSATSHPDTNEYAAFAQDTIRVTNRLAVNLGVRWDLQTFTTAGWFRILCFRHREKFRSSLTILRRVRDWRIPLGTSDPLVARAGYGIFYVRIPQIYNSIIQTENGITDANLFLSTSNYYDHQVFSGVSQSSRQLSAVRGELRLAGWIHARSHPRSLGVCAELRDAAGAAGERHAGKRNCRSHDRCGVGAVGSRGTPDPRARRESAAAGCVDLSDLRFHGIHLSRAATTRSIRLRPGNSRGRWTVRGLRASIRWDDRLLQLGAINEFQSAASSNYNGATLSINRRVARGSYLRFSYTYARAIDDGQDALVAGQPATVQNSYVPSAERGPSVTDQRHRLVGAFSLEPHFFHRGHEFLGHVFNDWRLSTVVNYGTGRPFNATVAGDPNQDSNGLNDRLPGYSRNAFTGPDYATTDLRVTRSLHFGRALQAQSGRGVIQPVQPR